MQHIRIYLIIPFLLYTIFASSQIYYSGFDNIYKYENGQEDLILYLNGDADYSQFCINQSTEEIYFSGYDSSVFDFEGRRVFPSTVSYSIYSNQSESMVLDERNNTIYSTRGGLLEAHNIDGDFGQSETIVTGSNIHGIAIDTLNEKLYYSDRGTNRIYTVNLDGTQNEELIYLPSGLADPRGLTLDLQRGKIYWANTGQNKIQRANLDGTEIENVVLGFESAENVSFNTAENIVYITDVELGAIFSYSLDLDVLDTMYVNASSLPSSIEYNAETGYLFWIDEYQNSGYRLDVTTNENTSILAGLSSFGDISFAVDELQEIIFVGVENGIFKFNADGSFGERISSYGADYLGDIALDILKEKIYFTSGYNSISRFDYEGVLDTTIYMSDYFDEIYNLQFDGLNNTLYFLEEGDIFRSDSSLTKEIFFDYTDDISLFTLDYINSKIYFRSGDLVYISNFDGSATEPILGTAINHMVADPASERLFYSNSEGIFTSELNGYYEEQYLETSYVDEFTFGSTDGYLVLPTTESEATVAQNTIVLTWEVASNFSGILPSSVVLGDFEIEKRNIFGTFENIGSVQYTTGATSYSFLDEDPTEGENEYRLRFISDINGLTSYSKYFSTDFVITSVDEFDTIGDLYFNFSNQLFINNGTSGELVIFSVDGQEVKRIYVDEGTKEIEINDLTSGTYFYKINGDTSEKTKGRFIKM